MKLLVIYFSKFGNTRKIAEAVAAKLEPAGSVRLVNLNQLGITDFESIDLVVMGSPTYRMNLPEQVRSTFESLPKRMLRKTPVAVFDTSYKMSRWLAPFTASPKLARKLRKIGGKCIVPVETFHVEGKEGPLYQGELERATVWTELIIKRLRGGTS